jgi:hypothetical protein
MTFFVGMKYLGETHLTRIWDEVDALDDDVVAEPGARPAPA